MILFPRPMMVTLLLVTSPAFLLMVRVRKAMSPVRSVSFEAGMPFSVMSGRKSELLRSLAKAHVCESPLTSLWAK